MNQEVTNFSPPLPPKIQQFAPPIPPKLKKDNFLKLPTEVNSERYSRRSRIISSDVKSNRNFIVQNEGYRFVEPHSHNLDFAKKDSDFIYENRNIIFKDSIEKDNEKKPKSLISKFKSLFIKKPSKKIKPKELKDNEYFSSHKSEGSILPSRHHHFDETSGKSFTCSEINNSLCAPSQNDCCFRVHVVNCIPMCQIHQPCHCFQMDHHLPRINSRFQNESNISGCLNCQQCMYNTHCHSQVPSLNRFTSFGRCKKLTQSNHDMQSLDNRSFSTIESNTDKFVTQPSTTLPIDQSFAQETNAITMSLHGNIQLLRKVGWYWGPLKLEEAEEIMKDRCDGTFIVRDSSHADYLFSISFRVNNNTHHTRIQFSQNKFWLSQESNNGGFETVVDLINETIRESENGKFRYFQTIDDAQMPTYAVILLYPLSRFRVMCSLKHIARFVIVSHVRSDHLDRLPLPEYLVSYLQDKDHHYVENFFNYVNIMKVSDLPSID